MTDVAIWLLRWTIAGAALSTLVIAAAYLLERRGQAVSLHLFRAALLAALMAPMIALAPPLLTFAATTVLFETERPFSRTVEQPAIERLETPAPIAQDRAPEWLDGASLNVYAIALISVWLAGVAFGAAQRLRSASQLSRAFRNGASYPTSFVECRLSADTRTPLVFGLLRPRMLAPADFSEWPAAEREAVLRHEAAHLRRGDLVWAALGDAVRMIYWWTPPVAILARQHMQVTEEACDSASIGGGENRHDYARTLLAITRRVGQHAAPGLAMTAPGLHRRIERLITPQGNGPTFAAAAAIVATAACVVLALSGPAAAQGERIRIYIFNAAGGTSDTYAFSDGTRAAAATVQSCVGRRLPNATTLVDQLEARINNGEHDELNPVTIVGPGSRIELGSCEPSLARNDHAEDNLVLIVDASKHQARRLIRQIHALPRADQREMLAELGLSDRPNSSSN